MVVSNLASQRYSTTQRSQGPQAGNWTVSSHDGATDSISEGCVHVENYLTVQNKADATDFGLGSISTQGGIDALGSLKVNGSGTFNNALTALSANISQNATISGQVTTAGATLTGTTDTTLSIPSGGITTYDAIVTNNLTTASTANSTFNGKAQFGSDVTITATDDTTAVGNGTLVVTGGASFGKNTQTGGNITGQQNIIALGNLLGTRGQFSSTNDAVSNTTNASVYAKGGIYTEKDAVHKGALAVYAGSSNNARVQVDLNGMHVLPDGTNNALDVNASQITTTLPLVFQNSNNATDYLGTSAGAAFTGGITVMKDQWLAGNLFLNGKVKGEGTVQFDNVTPSTSATTGAVVVLGGIGADHAQLANALVAGATNTIAATNTTSGNLQSRGGLGVVGDTYMGGLLDVTKTTALHSTLSVDADTTLSGNVIANHSGKTAQLNILNVTNNNVPATAADQTAALTVAGGMVVAKRSYFNDTATIANTLTLGADLTFTGKTANTTAQIITTSNALVTTAPTACTANIISDTALQYIDGVSASATTRFFVNSNYAQFFNSTNATSLTTAGLIANGGLAVAMDTLLGGKLTLSQSTDPASIKTTGGASIAGQTSVGGNLQVTGTSTLSGNNTLTGTLYVGDVATFNKSITAASGAFNGAINVGGTVAAQSSANVAWTGPTSTTPPSGSLISSGGGAVVADWQVGNNLTTYGNMLVKGSTEMDGNVVITSTTSSTASSPQALQVYGGASFSKGLVVTGPTIHQGDCFIYGNLSQTGTTSRVNVQNYYVSDNIITLNVNTPYPDSGLSFTRYQYANDNGSGFVVSDTPYTSFTVSASTNNATTVQLPSSASTTDNAYAGWLMITSGTGKNEVRHIKSYAGSTQILTINSTADQTAYNTANPPASGGTNVVIGLDFTTAPDSTSVVSLYNNTVGALLQQQLAATGPVFALGYLAHNPLASTTNNTFSQYGDLKLRNVLATKALEADAWVPYTSGANISLNGSVNVSSAGALTNVTSINGAPTPTTFAVTVSETATLTAGGTSIAIAKTWGTITYTITPGDANGSTAHGSITTNAQATSQGYSPNVSVTQLPGVNGEQVAMTWMNGSNPVVTLSTSRTASKQTGSPIPYTLVMTLY